jgi:hypothetical protein
MARVVITRKAGREDGKRIKMPQDRILWLAFVSMMMKNIRKLSWLFSLLKLPIKGLTP